MARQYLTGTQAGFLGRTGGNVRWDGLTSAERTLLSQQLPGGTLLRNWDGTAAGTFGASWNNIAGQMPTTRGITSEIDVQRQRKTFAGSYTIQGGKAFRVSSRWVGMDMEVRADKRMQEFFHRLDILGSPQDKKMFKRAIREVTRTTILPILRSEIPLGKRTKLRPRRLRATAQIYRVYDDKIILTVGREKTWKGPRGGRYGLWHASIVHARWHPFFPRAFQRGWKSFNQEMDDALNELMRYLAGRSVRFRGAWL